MDITESFRASVQILSRRYGFDEDRMKSVASALMFHNPISKSSFLGSANEIQSNIRKLKEYILLNKKTYMDTHHVTERERISIEQEVMLVTKHCHDKIETLKDSISSTLTSYSSCLNNNFNFGNSVNVDYNAHLHGIVLILSENLHELTSSFDQLRSIQIKKRFHMDEPKRRFGLDLGSGSGSVSVPDNRFGDSKANENRNEFSESNLNQSQYSILDKDTSALQFELSNLLKSSRETERRVMEISTLSHIFSTNVLQQSQQIEFIYKQAVEATQNIESGNKELKKTIGHNSNNRVFLIMFFVIMTFAVLFLDWYQ